jgi:carboxypeptidase Taq
MSIDAIKAHLEEYSYLKSIQSLLHWDMETMMPKGAVEDRARRLSYVQGKLHEHITGKKYERLLKDFAKGKLTPLEKKLLKEMRWDYELSKALPTKHVMELSHLTTMATAAWAEARAKNDWKSYEPFLDKLIALKKKETKYYGDKKPYDSLIKLHDKEFNSADIKKLFAELRVGLIKLASEVKKDAVFNEVKDLKGEFDIPSQKLLSEEVARLFGLTAENSRLDISTHPFSINISPQDQRITTRYVTHNLDSLSSTMHEVGHALYEAGLPREWEGTPFQEAVSLSVHESQSRFWENVIGRSEEFSNFIHPRMKHYFPKAMKGIDQQNLFQIFNKSVPNLIRVESCELYYNLHVIIRFEIEEMIFNEGLKTKDIPHLWNEKYKEYLGLEPKTHREGVLQDSHWAGGAFGYFPTYTLGNLITGSLYRKMKREVPKFSQKVEKGDFKDILSYLRKNLHEKGRSISSKDIVGELGTKDYLEYLREKLKA